VAAYSNFSFDFKISSLIAAYALWKVGPPNASDSIEVIPPRITLQGDYHPIPGKKISLRNDFSIRCLM
jgi:hypothetical protein